MDRVTTGDRGEEECHQKPLITRLNSCSSSDEVQQQYQKTAGDYDTIFSGAVYDGPRLASEAVLRMYPQDGPVPRGALRVMDIAAGTGLVGQRLHDAGITNLDALEPCQKMMEVAESRGIYQRLLVDTVGDHMIDVEDDTYDAVVIAGGFVQGHCPVNALDEMLRICKPGGYVVNAMRLEYLVTVKDYHQLEPHMDKLERVGLWRRIDRCVTDGYFQTTKQGITYIYQKL